MPETTFYPDVNPESTSVDGGVGENHSHPEALTWTEITGGVGNEAVDDENISEVGFCSAYTAENQDKWLDLYRAIFLFDTSSIPDDAEIISAIFSLYGESKVDDLNVLPNINIYSSNPAINTALVSGDFDSLGSTPFCDTPITYANWSITGYNDFTLNASGIAAISKTGITKFGVRNANYDVAGVMPTWTNYKWSYLFFYDADRGTVYKPKLVVIYSIVGGNPTINTEVKTFSGWEITLKGKRLLGYRPPHPRGSWGRTGINYDNTSRR